MPLGPLGKEMAGLDIHGPALIVAGRSAQAQLSDTWEQTFGEVGCSYRIHGFGGECSLVEIQRIRGAAEALSAGGHCRGRGRQGPGRGACDRRRTRSPLRELPHPGFNGCSMQRAFHHILGIGSGDGDPLRTAQPGPGAGRHAGDCAGPAKAFGSGDGRRPGDLVRSAGLCVVSSQKSPGRSARPAVHWPWPNYATGPSSKMGSRPWKPRGRGRSLRLLNVLSRPTHSFRGWASNLRASRRPTSIHNGLTVAPQVHAFYHGEKVAFGTLVQLVLENGATSEMEQVMDFCTRVGAPLHPGSNRPG